MNVQNTRRGSTQEVINENCHSKFNLESHHMLLSKVRSRIKYGMTPLFNNGKYVEDPRQNSSGMTSNFIMARGFTLRPSSSRSVSMRDIGAARHGFTARSVTPQCRYAGYSGRIGFTLIELLVVVLIIGILAAVALPQYQLAVLKSRNMQALLAGKSYIDSQRLYKLEHGTYASSMDDLDFTFPSMPSWTVTGPHADGHLQIIYKYPSYDLTWDFQLPHSLVCIVRDRAANTTLYNKVCQSITNTTTFYTDTQRGGRKLYTIRLY